VTQWQQYTSDKTKVASKNESVEMTYALTLDLLNFQTLSEASNPRETRCYSDTPIWISYYSGTPRVQLSFRPSNRDHTLLRNSTKICYLLREFPETTTHQLLLSPFQDPAVTQALTEARYFSSTRIETIYYSGNVLSCTPYINQALSQWPDLVVYALRMHEQRSPRKSPVICAITWRNTLW
jgi:hypothetical protein